MLKMFHFYDNNLKQQMVYEFVMEENEISIAFTHLLINIYHVSIHIYSGFVL